MINLFIEQIIKEPNKNAILKAKLEVVDWIGYALAGTATNQALPFLNLQQSLPKGQSLNLFGKRKLNVFDSAFINASVGNILELDDVHRTSIIHPGDTVIPAAIATSSFVNIDTLNFLKAIIIGYETAIRMGICLGEDHYKTFYSSATCGVFGAAAASSYILNFKNKDQTLNKNLNSSIQLATMTSSGVWQCRKGDGEAKQYALANACRAGVTAAFLSQNGAQTPLDMIEGELGFLKGYKNEIDYKELIQPNDNHLINDISNKPWPACRHSHPVIGVSLDLKKELLKNNIQISQISEIVIETYKTAIDFCDKIKPKNDIEGKFSLQHCCAISLNYGDILEDYFKENILNDIEISEIREKVIIKNNSEMTDNFPNNYSASLLIKLKDGSILKKTNLNAKGDPENPMTEKEICDKTFNLINSNFNGLENIDLLIKNIISNEGDSLEKKLNWFDDLQKLINKGTKKC
jgi:2-methylcitrate dehydratase PrpD